MEKVKKLLLFGILTLLGIGSSFGATIPFYFDYFTIDGGLSSYNLNNNTKNFIPCIYSANSRDYVFDLQFYGQSCDSSFNSNYLGFNVYYDSNGNKLSYRLNASANSRPGYLFVLSSNLASENINDVGNGAYSRILAGSDCLGSDIFQSGSFCIPNFIELFTNKNYTISSLGNIYDSDYNGVRYYKGPVSPAVGLGYSFGFVTGSGWQNDGNHYYLNTGNGDFFTFRSISFSGSQTSSFEGVLLMRLNNTYNVSGSSNYELFALGLTGNINDYSFIYSIYNCPSTAGKYSDCVFSEGGNISENFSYDFESSNPYSNLIYLLTKLGGVKLNNSYSSVDNQITLSSQDGTSYYVSTYSITLNLVPTDGIDIIGSVPGGNGNQSTGSIAINTGFLDLCLNNLEFGELNSYLCNKLFNGNNLVLIPGQTGYYLSYGYDENGNLRFWITYQEDLEQQMSGYIWEQDENGNWYTYLPEELNTGVDYSNGLKDYFNNWFEHGVFFSCPFHYTDSYYREFKLFGITHFVPKLGQSFLYPIYCMGAGFREGKNIDFFSGVNLGLESQLLSSSDYNYIYRLFDLILSVLILFFIIKIYHLLN